METRLQNLNVPAERLMHAQPGSGNLVDGALEAAADAGTPNVQTSSEVAAALEAGLVAGALEFFSLEVLEVLVVAFLDDLVLLLHQI